MKGTIIALLATVSIATASAFAADKNEKVWDAFLKLVTEEKLRNVILEDSFADLIKDIQ